MQRSVGLIFFGVFAIAGLGLGVVTLGGLARWFGGLGWQSVPATAEVLRIDEDRDSEGTSYRIECRYRYQFGAQEFVSDRVSFFDVGSSSDTYARTLHRELYAANEAGTMTCLVNPSDPSQAVLDGRIQSAMLGFTLLFLMSHGSVGVAGLAYLWATVPPRLDDGRYRLVSDHAGKRSSSIAMLGLHSVSLAMAVTIAISGIGAGQWGAIVPMVLAAVSAVVVYFCWRYVFEKQPSIGRLWLPDQDGKTMGLRLPWSAAEPIDLEIRWVLPPRDSEQTGVENIESPGESVQGRVLDQRIEFDASAPPSQWWDKAASESPTKVKLEMVGTIAGRGYQDSFTLTGDALAAVRPSPT
ncbi:hypothetical protein Poly51_31500 [Rubripirellula tenax]|uniref:DUF3592 domain-containing protein n=1 Tax=Rubripirellula tenax TaxID=2528015 RepID=A0A5C6F4P8_9BACT|nr:DUF3592 domain-containing protein [Rubripirellula tenax]TWU54431.1 hypothetical protein Poly51_31500 [Rubripirellula tenax]